MNPVWLHKKQAAERALSEAVDILNWSKPSVSTQLREGDDVSREILDASREMNSNLIMVGSKGKSLLKKILLGSITKRLARHAQCSVWVVRN